MIARMVIIALALSVSPSLVLADNPSDAPLLSEERAPEVVQQECNDGGDRRESKKERAAKPLQKNRDLKTQHALPATESDGGMQ